MYSVCVLHTLGPFWGGYDRVPIIADYMMVAGINTEFVAQEGWGSPIY